MRKLFFALFLSMHGIGMALAETIDGITYSLDTSTSTATVTNTPSGSVVIPATVTYNNRKYNVTTITGVNSDITSVEIPEGVTSVGDAFYQKSLLTSIVIPSTVQRLEKMALAYCSSLTNVSLSDGLTYIGNKAFFYCTSLPSITIPSTITSMGESSFSYCKNLKTIIWNAKHCADFVDYEAAPFNGNQSGFLYYRNDFTISITFGSEVDYIPAYLCSNLFGLLAIDIPNSVKGIGDHAFDIYYVENKASYSDGNLRSITFGTGLETIGSYAFNNRWGLSSIIIPDKCNTIGTNAFSKCNSLSAITFGKGITTIGTSTFADCPNINTINIYATTPPVIAKDVFSSISDLMAVTLNVRTKAVDAYKAAAVWKDMYVQAMENDVRTFTLSVSSADESKGTTTEGGAYDEDSEILIYAASKSGYKFSKWNDGSTDNPRIVKMIGNLSFVAQFEPFIPLSTYTITANANAIEGTAVGSGIYEAGTQATLAGVGNTGYHFVKWADGNTTNPRQVTVTEDASYTAQFEKDAAKYTLTISSTNASQGTAYGQGKYEEGSNVAIFAVANDGYHFTQWHDGNTENPRMITVSNDAMFFANFAQAPTLYELEVKPENTSQGWTTEGGAYEWGKQLMVYAHPVNGFMFSQWSDGNKENPRFLTVTGNVNLTAQFETQNPNNINSVNASTTAKSVRKIIRNGQTVIEYDDKIYTLQGVEAK